MRNTNKKGFTIVELVIVVAVIAILAAVLIPTFSGIIAKAQLSADQKAEHDMNTALAIEGNPADLDAVIDALIKNGFNGENLVPVSKDYSYVWSQSEKVIKLVKTADIKADETNLKEGVKYIDVVTKDTASLENALATGAADIKLDGDVKLSKEVEIPAGAKVTLDLNGKALTTEQVTGRSKYLNVAGELVITNGTIEARGIQVMNGGKLVIGENANVTVANVDSNGGAAIWVYAGGEVEINGGTFTALNGNKNLDDLSKNPGVINNSGKLTINGGTFKSENTVCYLVQNFGEMEINGGTFEGTHGIIANHGTATINGGTFTLKAFADGTAPTGHHIFCSTTTTVDSDVVFNGVDYKEYTSGDGSVVRK